MQIKFKKPQGLKAISIILDVVFLLVIIIDAFILKDLYKTLNTPPQYQEVARITRINTPALDQATQRFNASQSYVAPSPTFGDPFTNFIPKQ